MTEPLRLTLDHVDLPKVIDELTYRSYFYNRTRFPNVAVNRWMALFRNVPDMEVRYQMEKSEDNNG